MSCRISPAMGLHSIKEFEYYSPKTLHETLSLIEKSGSEAKLIAGGTDLVPLLKLRLAAPRYIVNICNLSELDFVKLDGTILRIGALTTHSTLERSSLILERAYILAEAALQIGSPQIRNTGTVGGNLVNASPCSDTATPLLALGANLKLVKSDGERMVALDEFFLHVKKTVLQDNELLKEIQIPEQSPGTAGAFIKVGRRAGHELSVVSVAATITVQKNVCRNARIALGSVAPTPIRVRKAESCLAGKTLDERR